MTTHQLLQFTPSEMEMLVMNIKLQWADIYSCGNDTMCQQLLTDKRINKWFKIELEKRLKEFEKALKPYLNDGVEITQQERMKLFVSIVSQIYAIYPSALLTQVKPKTIKK